MDYSNETDYAIFPYWIVPLIYKFILFLSPPTSWVAGGLSLDWLLMWTMYQYDHDS